MEGENKKPMRRVGGMVGCSFRVVGGRRGCVVLNPSRTYLSSFSSSFSASPRKRQFHCLSSPFKGGFSDLPRRHHLTRSTVSLSNPLDCFPPSSQFITEPYTTCSSSPSYPLSRRLLQQESVSGPLLFHTLRSEGRTARHFHTVKSYADPRVSSLLCGTSCNQSRSHAGGRSSPFKTRGSDEGKGKPSKHKLLVGAGTGCAVGAASLVLGLFLPTTRAEEKDLPSRAEEDHQQSGAWYHSLRYGFGSLFSSNNINSHASTIPGLYSRAASSLSSNSQSSSSLLLSRCLPSFLPSQRRAEVLPAQCSSRDENDAPGKSLSGSTAPSSESLYQELSADSCLQLFAGTGHPELAREIAAHLNVAVGRAHVGRYADGECVIQVLDEVRGKDVFVIQSAPAAGGDVHSCLMELFLLLTALRRSSAKRITAVIPCMPYDRETELSQGDENILTPMAAADLSVLLQVCGADSVMFVDIHNPRMEGFFTYPSTRPIPMLNVQPHQLAVRYLKKKDLVNPVVVATDNTGGEKAKAMWSLMRKNGIQAGFTSMVCDAPKRQAREGNPILFSPPATVSEDSSSAIRKDSKTSRDGGEKAEDKTMPNGSVGSWNHVGDVAGRDCIIIDDIIDTGEKAQATAMDLKAGGARRIFMFATHGVLSKGSVDRINNSPIQEVIVTNTVPIPPHVCCEKLVVLSVGKLMAEAIKRVHEERSVSGLFGDQNARLNEQRQFE